MPRIDKTTLKISKLEVKNCPFCNDDELDGGPFPANREETEWILRCGNPTCNVELIAKSRIEVINKWNRRSEGSNNECIIGVGNGDTYLFVHGNYESIKKVEKLIDENVRLRTLLDQTILR